LQTSAAGNKRPISDVVVSGVGTGVKSQPNDRSDAKHNFPVKSIPTVAAQRSMRQLNFGRDGILSNLFRSFRPDGVVLGKFGSADRWDVDGSVGSVQHNEDTQLDMQAGALYNIIVEGFGVCSNFWGQSSQVFQSPQKHKILPRDKLFLLVVANTVAVTTDPDPQLRLSDFVLVRASSADLFRMAGLVGATEADGRYSTSSSLEEMFGHAIPGVPAYKDPYGATIAAVPAKAFNPDARIVGGWEIGSVTDNAAAETTNSFAGPKSNGKRQRQSFMSMQLNVNIRWIDSFELHERYWTNVEVDAANPKKRKTIVKFINP
jgi:hypothetical protein